MTTSDQERRKSDLRVAEDIAKYGCHVVSVFDPEEKQPTFSYTIGVQDRTGCPEAIVIGVRPSLGHSMVNEYNHRVQDGFKFERGVAYAGFIEGFPVYVEPAKLSLASEYTLGCSRFYKNREYAVVQLVYPSTTGAWPWQASASEWFKENQPMLGRARPNRR